MFSKHLFFFFFFFFFYGRWATQVGFNGYETLRKTPSTLVYMVFFYTDVMQIVEYQPLVPEAPT